MSDEKNARPSAPTGKSGNGPEEPTAVFAETDDTDSGAPIKKPRGDDGFGLWYRFFFRFQYALLHIIGPPRLSKSLDPRTRMKADYERRKALYQQWKASRGKS